MPSTESRPAVLTYLLLVFLFSSVFYALILTSRHLGAGGGLYVVGLMWFPGLAAMATLKLRGRSLSELGWKWGQTRYQVQSWAIPLLYAAVTYAIVWATGLGGFYNPEFVARASERMGLPVPAGAATLLYVLLLGILGMARSLSTALGEEIGWRGFLVPELWRTASFTRTALLSGMVWSVWHYPILLFADYNAGTPAWYGLTCFTVGVVSLSFVMAWLRLKSGSLWTGAILHASHNLYIQNVFTPLTRNTGRTQYFIDEFGCVLPAVILAFAVYYWRKHRELTQPVQPEASSSALAASPHPVS